MIKLYKKCTRKSKILIWVSLVGFFCILVGVKFSNNFFGVATGTIGTILITNILLQIINKSIEDTELIDKVCKYIKAETCANQLGLVKIGVEDYKVETSAIIDDANKYIDVMHVCGKSWTSNNRAKLIKKLRGNKIKIRVVISDYRQENILNIYKVQFNNNDIKSNFEGVINLWKDIYRESNKSENLEVYLFNGIISSALYINEENAVALHFASHKARGNDEMTAVKCKNITNGLFERYKTEFKLVINEANLISDKW